MILVITIIMITVKSNPTTAPIKVMLISLLLQLSTIQNVHNATMCTMPYHTYVAAGIYYIN